MIHKKFSLFGRFIPAWVLAGLLVLAASGAATGTVLAGQVTGDLGVTISQSLLVGDVDTRTKDNNAADSYDAVTDDKTAFTSGIELLQGDCYYVGLFLENASDFDLTADMVLDLPNGITADAVKGTISSLDSDCEVSGTVSADDTTELVRATETTWQFDLASTSTASDDIDISIILALGDMVTPGFYTIGAEFVQTDR